MKNKRLKEIIDSACVGTGGGDDCSNGAITNTGGAANAAGADYGFANWAANTDAA